MAFNKHDITLYFLQNLVELNITGQSELTPNSICSILCSMRQLKKLNISHTKANIKVAELIAKTCNKLEYLNLDNCINLYDNCIELLCEHLHKTLTFLSVDNIELTKNTLIHVLLKCQHLKFFYALHSLDIIQSLFNSSLYSSNP